MELLLFFFLIAAVYAAAGFGGGSSYLAVLAIAGFSMNEMRPAALVCNIIVTAGGAVVFGQKGLLDWRRIWPLFASVPAAWIGARWPISEPVFMALLGLSLVAAGLLMLFQKTKTPQKVGLPSRFSIPFLIEKEAKSTAFLAVLGIALGFLAGMTGIGGGIFLAPVLHFLRFAEPKKIAATTSVFILANSAAGLLGGFFSKNWVIDWAFVGTLAFAVLLGGQLGSRLSVRFLPPRYVRFATAALVLYAGISVLEKLL